MKIIVFYTNENVKCEKEASKRPRPHACRIFAPAAKGRHLQARAGLQIDARLKLLTMAGVSRLARALRHSSLRSIPAVCSSAVAPVTSACVSSPLVSTRVFTTGSSPSFSPVHIEDEPYCRQRQLITLGNRVSIWYGCVLRGDLNSIRIGAFSNVQDRTVMHAARTSPTGLSAATTVGRYVTIGQGCVLRSATIEDEVLIGEKCVLMEGSLVENHSILAPGSVLPPGRLVPSGQLWAGNPAKFVRNLSKDEKAEIAGLASAVFKLTDRHSSEFLPVGTAYIQAEKLKKALQETSSA